MNGPLLSRVRAGLRWSPFLLVAVAARLISALNVILLMRKLSPEGFAHFAYFQISTGYIAGFALMGLDVSANVLLSRAGSSRSNPNAIYFSALATALATIAFVLPVLNFAYLSVRSPEGSGASLGAACLAGSALVLQGVTAGLLAGRALNLVAVSLNAVVSLGFLVFCAAIQPDANIAIVGYFVSQYLLAALNVVAYSYSCGREFEVARPKIAIIEKLLAFGVKNAGVSAAVNLVQLSSQTRMLGAQGTATVENAKYAFAGQVYNILIFVPVMLSPVLINHIARKDSERARWGSCLRLGGAVYRLVVAGTGRRPGGCKSSSSCFCRPCTRAPNTASR